MFPPDEKIKFEREPLERTRDRKVLLAGLMVGLMLAVLVVLFIYMHGTKHG